MKLRAARETKGLKQSEVAEQMRARGFTTTQSTLSYWENVGPVQGPALVALAEILGTEIESRPSAIVRRAIYLLENEGYTVVKNPK